MQRYKLFCIYANEKTMRSIYSVVFSNISRKSAFTMLRLGVRRGRCSNRAGRRGLGRWRRSYSKAYKAVSWIKKSNKLMIWECGLYINAFCTFVQHKVHFQRNTFFAAIGIYFPCLNLPHIHLITARQQFAEKDILHNVRYLILAETHNRITNTEKK